VFSFRPFSIDIKGGSALRAVISNNTRNWVPCLDGWRRRHLPRRHLLLPRARHFPDRPEQGAPAAPRAATATAQASPLGTAALRNNSAADSISHIEKPLNLELHQERKMLYNRRSRTEPFRSTLLDDLCILWG
jgi:hypothetical protein